jgi:hypothetical protein
VGPSASLPTKPALGRGVTVEEIAAAAGLEKAEVNAIIHGG